MLFRSLICESNENLKASIVVKPEELQTAADFRKKIEGTAVLANFEPWVFLDIDGDAILPGQEGLMG